MMSGEANSSEAFRAHDAVSTWIQDIAPYGVFTTDSSLRIRSWNQWLASRSAWTAETLNGKLLAEAFPELVERRLMERYQRALSGEVSVLSSALHRHLLPITLEMAGSDAPTMLQTVRIAPLLAGKEIVGTITIIEDVTERETQAVTLQRQQQHDSMLSRALSVLLRSDDPMRDIAELLPAFVPNLGIDAFFLHTYDVREDMLILNAAGGLLARHKEELARFPLGHGPCGEAASSHEPVVLSDLARNTDPRYQALRDSSMKHFACFPISLGNQLFGTLSVGGYGTGTLPADEVKFLTTLVQYVAISIERRGREEQLGAARIKLQQHADDLETKVTERTARLNETIAHLESFSYTVAHDLRAPIRALKGYSEVLEQEYTDQLSPEGLAILARIKNSGAHLDALTRDLLKFSKLSGATLQMGPVDLTRLVNSVISNNPGLESRISVVEPLGTVQAHHVLLSQCFSNIFENALKFSDPGRKMKITVSSELRSPSQKETSGGPSAFNPAVFSPAEQNHGVDSGDETLRVWIEDNGVGIPEHARARIFGIFERVTSTTSVEGTGIGLAIVARAMQRMGGACGVESNVGHGSRFWLQFPHRP